MCICKNKICIWSDSRVNLPICKYTPVCICVRMRHLLTPSKICTPEYIYTRVFLAHANWTLVWLTFQSSFFHLCWDGAIISLIFTSSMVLGVNVSCSDTNCCQGGWVGIWVPAHRGLGEIDGLLVPPSKASNLLTYHLITG